jgi:uncharacterized protein (TIGR02145 family)
MVYKPFVSLCALCVLGGALVFTCTKENTLYTPTGKQPARCFGRLSASIINNPSGSDTSGLAKRDTIHTGDSIVFIGIVTPANAAIVSATWNFGDGTSSQLPVSIHRFSRGGKYTGVFTITDRVGITLSDTVVVGVNTPPGPITLLLPANGQSGLDPQSNRTFKWACRDNDGDTLLFRVFFNTSRNFISPFAETTSSEILIQDPNLTKLTTYYWMVKAIDAYGESSTSDTFRFKTKDPNATTGSIEGYAVFQGWTKHSGVLINLLDSADIHNSKVTATATDEKGFFSIRNLTPKTYKVIADDTLYKKFISATCYAAVEIGSITGPETLILKDPVKPVIYDHSPVAVQSIRTPQISIKYSDNASGILVSSAGIFLDDSNITTMARIGNSGLECTFPDRLPDGKHRVAACVMDSAGNRSDTLKWSFLVDAMSLSAMADTVASINDTLFIQCTVKNVFSRVKQYAWDYDHDGVWDDSIESSDTAISHPHVFKHEAYYTVIASARDDFGMTKLDTIKINVKQDTPQIAFLSGDTVIDHGEAVRCSVFVRQQFGTMQVEIDTGNDGHFKDLGSLGLSGGNAYSFSTGNASDWDSVKVRISDDDGNMVTEGFKLDIRPQPLTITSIDSTLTAITVHFAHTQETDFLQYRIFRGATNNVDMNGELFATITESGTVSYTTPSPSYAWMPRYYRTYQLDKEGLWSAGSNVVYGNIRNCPPGTPVITCPAKNGDSIWSNNMLRWTKCNDPNDHPVRYRILINYNNSGYSEYTTEVTDTFFRLEGYDSLGIAFKVIAYDNFGDSSYSTERTAIIRTSLVDIEGNVYKIIRFGSQLWMTENLRTTKYTDNTNIPYVTDSGTWAGLATPAYCYYDTTTDAAARKKWGVLYNWYAIDPMSSQKVTPDGWHVPTKWDWDNLQNYLIANGYNYDATVNGNKIAKSIATATNDWSITAIEGAPGNNPGANNKSGFSALPAGCRNLESKFIFQGVESNWWNSTEYDASEAYYSTLYYNDVNLGKSIVYKVYGFSVRLMRDAN